MNSHRRQSTNKRKHQNEINPTKRTKVETEKRLRRFRTSMSIAIYDRIERALTQRLYLLAMTKSSNEHLQREYKVLGQTANVYTVIISHLPSCTCKSNSFFCISIAHHFDIDIQVLIMLKVIYVNISYSFYIVF